MLSKWFGESTQKVSALFKVARKMNPSVIFMDEIEALAISRTENANSANLQGVSTLLAELDGMGSEMCLAFWNLLGDEQKGRAGVPYVVTAPERMPIPLPWVKSRTDFLDKGVTYALTAIGLCMMLGLCNRLACLGGGAFLISVLLTQPPWPTIYPPAPEVVGHALVIDKNFVEMVAAFALAALPVGRWAGLDHFLYHWFGRRFESYFSKDI